MYVCTCIVSKYVCKYSTYSTVQYIFHLYTDMYTYVRTYMCINSLCILVFMYSVCLWYENLAFSGHVHLTDFNVACYVVPGTPITSCSGTKPYMGECVLCVSGECVLCVSGECESCVSDESVLCVSDESELCVSDESVLCVSGECELCVCGECESYVSDECVVCKR